MARIATSFRHGPRVIVLGTDLTSASKHALSRTIHLAQRHAATVHVVHALPRLPRALLRRVSSVQDGKVRAALDELTDQVRRAGVRVRGHLAEGDAVEVLTVKARALAADLVVVGTRGRSIPDAMIGSTAERIIAADGHRVLLVRRPGQRDYREVLVAASEHSRLRKQLAAAALFTAKPISLLHAFEGPFESALRSHGASVAELRSYRADARREAASRMAKVAEQAGGAPERLVLRHGKAVQLLQRVDRDALLVVSRGRSVVRRLLFGSVTRAVVAHGGSDLLLV